MNKNNFYLIFLIIGPKNQPAIQPNVLHNFNQHFFKQCYLDPNVLEITPFTSS